MLVLTRKTAEWIQIGDVRVYVVRTNGNRVQLGIEAPPQVKVLRGELVQRPPEKEAA